MRGPVKIVNRKKDLKQGYLIRLEIGFIVSLLIFISAAKINIGSSDNGSDIVLNTQEEVFMEEVIQTKQELRAPPPPRPMVPVAVPNDEIIEDEIIDLDSELDLDGGMMELPPPPPRSIEKEEQEIFVVVEQMPELIGGLSALQKHITYPEMAIRAGIEGRVVVQFLIQKDGSVKDPYVIRGIGGGCDEEAIKAVKKVTFTPGKQRGKPVVVRYSLPVSFKLEKNN
jgi:protein TonB